MDKQLRYREKHVHDLPVEDSFVRLWDAEGAINGEIIRSAFQPLLATGLVWPYVALMPDYHSGEGSMIGSVIPTKEVILLTVVGGDIGCGMTAIRLPIQTAQVSSALPRIEQRLRKAIPVGTAHNAVVLDRVQNHPIWDRDVRAPVLANRMRRKMLRQFASLGGGNHFLEIQRDQDEQVWIMLHSGSRFLGVTVRDYYVKQGRTQEGIDPKLYARFPHLIAGSRLADNYLADLSVVLDFARASRKEMLLRALEVAAQCVPEIDDDSCQPLADAAYDIHHNFVAEEEHFGQKLFAHRKGAIRLAAGQVGLVPGSMGTNSYVVEGRGNPFALNSCSHGAGRAMSRADAFRTISDKHFADSLEGVVHQHDVRMKDEAPEAYKDIRRVMRSQKDLVRIVHTVQPLLSLKGR